MLALGSVECWLRGGDSWGQHLVPDGVRGVRDTMLLTSELLGLLREEQVWVR